MSINQTLSCCWNFRMGSVLSFSDQTLTRLKNKFSYFFSCCPWLFATCLFSIFHSVWSHSDLMSPQPTSIELVPLDVGREVFWRNAGTHLCQSDVKIFEEDRPNLQHWHKVTIIQKRLYHMVASKEGLSLQLQNCPSNQDNHMRTLLERSWMILHPFTPRFKKYILPPFKTKCVSEVVRIGCIMIFHLSKL